MSKSIIAYIFCAISLGSCSISQNSVTNTTTAQLSNASNYNYAAPPSIEQNKSQPTTKLIAPAQTSSKCKPQAAKNIIRPKFNDEAILNAKTQKDMINYLLAHIEQLDKTIDTANNNIRNINNQNSKNCW